MPSCVFGFACVCVAYVGAIDIVAIDCALNHREHYNEQAKKAKVSIGQRSQSEWLFGDKCKSSEAAHLKG